MQEPPVWIVCSDHPKSQHEIQPNRKISAQISQETKRRAHLLRLAATSSGPAIISFPEIAFSSGERYLHTSESAVYLRKRRQVGVKSTRQIKPGNWATGNFPGSAQALTCTYSSFLRLKPMAQGFGTKSYPETPKKDSQEKRKIQH